MTTNDAYVTIDADWAPDFCIAWLSEELLARDVGHTIFMTHRTPAVLFGDQRVEIGLHPDFSRKSFEEAKDAVKSLVDYYGSVAGSRSHRNVFGQHVANFLYGLGLRYDVSTLLWNRPNPWFIDHNGLARFSYSWEDGYHLDMSAPLEGLLWNNFNPWPLIINLHPVLMYLNLTDDNQRRKVLEGISDSTALRRKFLDDRRLQFGIADSVFREIDKMNSSGVRFRTMQDLWRTVA